jgi:hypothetical protein
MPDGFDAALDFLGPPGEEAENGAEGDERLHGSAIEPT